MKALILAGLFTVTHCSTPKKQKETLHPLDSTALQSKPGSGSFFSLLARNASAGKDEFDVDPDVVISDNIDEVKRILLRIKLSDESRRDNLHKALDKHGDYGSDEVRRTIRKMKSNDSVNQIVLTRILSKYGWPTIQMFGEHASHAAFLVLIHSDLSFQLKHISLLQAAAKNKAANSLNYAIMIDRILRGQRKKQLYGTHGFLEPKSNKIILLPIENETEVNKRRADLGLPELDVNKCDMLIQM